MKNKRGQETMGMPFGVIFAIFLIIVFFLVAFFAIRGFLDFEKSSSVLSFYENLEEDVNSVWKSQSSSKNFEIDLPSKVSYVCFANLSAEITGPVELHKQIRHYEFYEANVFILPGSSAEGMEFKYIPHLDISKTTENENPYCVLSDSTLKIEKDFYDKLVSIK